MFVEYIYIFIYNFKIYYIYNKLQTDFTYLLYFKLEPAFGNLFDKAQSLSYELCVTFVPQDLIFWVHLWKL